MGATVITRQEDLPPLPPLLISLGATREQQSPAERSITPPVITVDKTRCLCLPPRLPNPWWWQELYVPLWNDVRARRRGLGLCHMASRMQCSCLHVLLQKALCLLTAAQCCVQGRCSLLGCSGCTHVRACACLGCVYRDRALLLPRCFSTRFGTCSPLEAIRSL